MQIIVKTSFTILFHNTINSDNKNSVNVKTLIIRAYKETFEPRYIIFKIMT